MQGRIKATLTLNRNIWNGEKRRSIKNQVLKKTAEKLENKILDNYDSSTPAGRFYNIGNITARRTAANKNLPRQKGTSTRVVVGKRQYQASAVGQPPAKRTGFLRKNIKVRRIVGKDAVLAQVIAPGVGYLDSPDYFNRPFFESIVVPYSENELVQDAKDMLREFLQAHNSDIESFNL